MWNILTEQEYIDGTKIESKANKYTFVWRKTVEHNRERLMKKIRVLLSQIDDVIAQEKASENNDGIEFTPSILTEMAGELRNALEQTAEPSTKEQKSELKKKHKQLKELEAHRDKLQEYNTHLDNLQDRNSYSKTDKEATFMRMKEDAMRNGQTKPGYNLQIATENQFIIDYSLFPNPTDTLTMIPFLKSVADSGYGSEENYHFMSENGMEAYVKYNCFHMEQRPRFKPNPFKAENFFYNEEQDYCVCPMGQKMQRAGTRHTKTESGYVVEYARYRAVRCEGCPLRCLCFKAKGNRTIEQDIQTESPGTSLFRRRVEIQRAKVYRAGSCIWTDKIQHELQALPSFWEGQGSYGLFLPGHRLQYKKDVYQDE